MDRERGWNAACWVVAVVGVVAVWVLVVGVVFALWQVMGVPQALNAVLDGRLPVLIK